VTRPQLVAPVGIRLLVLDVDDTMAPHGGLPSPEVVRALRELHADGVEIMVATGRPAHATRAPPRRPCWRSTRRSASRSKSRAKGVA